MDVGMDDAAAADAIAATAALPLVSEAASPARDAVDQLHVRVAASFPSGRSRKQTNDRWQSMDDVARRTKRQRLDGGDHSDDVKVLRLYLALCMQLRRWC